MCGCECWTIKKAFELWYWRRVPWTARKFNQSVLKEISPECSLEGQMLKLKLQYFDHLMWRADSLERTLILGKIEGWRRRGQQKMWWSDCITYSMDMSLSKLQEVMKDRESWRVAVHEVAKSQTQFSNWTTTTIEYQDKMLSQWVYKKQILFLVFHSYCFAVSSIIISQIHLSWGHFMPQD